MTATLHIIGTGPGDPGLLTLKAVRTVEACPVVISPRGSRTGPSTALSIISAVVSLEQKLVHEIHFPMKKIHFNREPAAEVLQAWNSAAGLVLDYLDSGRDVCFPTLGDPAIYSTGYYLYETICSIRPDSHVSFVPGVPAMSSCSASLAAPICLGNEMVAVIPATFSDKRIKQVLRTFDTIVLMKVHRVLDRVIRLLRECDLLEYAALVERAGTEEEEIYRRLDRISGDPHYYSTILVRKNAGHASSHTARAAALQRETSEAELFQALRH